MTTLTADSSALAGLTVLDLSRLLPGPLATQWFADLGARVIKIEDPKGGDYLRLMPPFIAGSTDDTSAMFIAINRGKESLSLDLKSPAHKAAFVALAAKADVVVESFRPGVMAKLGIGYDDIKAVNPSVILCSISGYGQTGPMAHAAGHDIGYSARAGALGLWGPKDGAIGTPGVQVADIAGGSYSAALAVMTALFRRERTGQGAWLDVSMTDGVLAFHAMTLGERAGTGQPLKRGDETLTGGVPCYGVYRCGDGRYLAVGSLEPKFWTKFIAAIGLPELADRGLDRDASGDEVRGQVSRRLAEKARDEWVALLAPLDVCVEPVWEGDEVFSDPLHRARGRFIAATLDGETPAFETVSVPFSGTNGLTPPRALTSRRAPRLGEHNGALAAEFGLRL